MPSKSELVAHVAAATNTTKAEAAVTVDAVLEGIHKLADEGAIRLAPLGTFEIKDVAARTARNPRTGEPVAVPAGRQLKLKTKKVVS